MNTTKTEYAVMRTAEGTRYGTIIAKHRSEQTAQSKYESECRAVRRRYPNAITHLMYEVVQLPTPAGQSGKVGERIAIDLSRQH